MWIIPLSTSLSSLSASLLYLDLCRENIRRSRWCNLGLSLTHSALYLCLTNTWCLPSLFVSTTVTFIQMATQAFVPNSSSPPLDPSAFDIVLVSLLCLPSATFKLVTFCSRKSKIATNLQWLWCPPNHIRVCPTLTWNLVPEWSRV